MDNSIKKGSRVEYIQTLVIPAPLTKVRQFYDFRCLGTVKRLYGGDDGRARVVIQPDELGYPEFHTQTEFVTNKTLG